MEKRNGIIVSKTTDKKEVIKFEKKALPFVFGLICFVGLIVFSVLMIVLNVNYFSSIQSEGFSFLKIVIWLLSGRGGFYLVFSWVISILCVVLFFKSMESEIYVISIISKVLLFISALSFLVPIVALGILLS